MVAGLGDLSVIERNGRLSPFGYLLNSLIALSCLGTLSYPFLDAGGIINIDCLFRSITGFPCPSCGYSTAVGCLLSGEIGHSFLHNPGWIFWIAFQVLLVYIGIKSIITGKQAIIQVKLVIPLVSLIILTWVAKFIIGPEFY